MKKTGQFKDTLEELPQLLLVNFAEDEIVKVRKWKKRGGDFIKREVGEIQETAPSPRLVEKA